MKLKTNQALIWRVCQCLWWKILPQWQVSGSQCKVTYHRVRKERGSKVQESEDRSIFVSILFQVQLSWCDLILKMTILDSELAVFLNSTTGHLNLCKEQMLSYAFHRYRLESSKLGEALSLSCICRNWATVISWHLILECASKMAVWLPAQYCS